MKKILPILLACAFLPSCETTTNPDGSQTRKLSPEAQKAANDFAIAILKAGSARIVEKIGPQQVTAQK